MNDEQLQNEAWLNARIPKLRIDFKTAMEDILKIWYILRDYILNIINKI